MIAGKGDDRRRIVTVGLIKLVVVILRLAEAVDDVAEMKEKARRLLVLVGEVIHHLVGNKVLVLRAARAAGIAGRVKHDLTVRSEPLL